MSLLSTCGGAATGRLSQASYLCVYKVCNYFATVNSEMCA